MTKFFALVVVILEFSATSFAQTSSAIALADIITAYYITKTTDMNFGVIVSERRGTVELDYADGRVAFGGVTLINGTGSSAPKTAVFTVTGTGTSAYSIVIPTSPITLTGTTEGMTVSRFESETGLTGNLVNGSAIIKVKATLNVPAYAVPGFYSNASGLSVTVAYN